MGAAAVKEHIEDDVKELGSLDIVGQFWQVSSAAHIRCSPGGAKCGDDLQEGDIVVEERRQQHQKLSTDPNRLWLLVVRADDKKQAAGWTAVHDRKTGERKLNPISKAEKHAVDLANLLGRARQHAMQWKNLLFCNEQHELEAAISAASGSNDRTPAVCAVCAGAFEPEVSIMACGSGCVYGMCFECAEVRAGKREQADNAAYHIETLGVHALHNSCTVQGLSLIHI